MATSSQAKFKFPFWLPSLLSQNGTMLSGGKLLYSCHNGGYY